MQSSLVCLAGLIARRCSLAHAAGQLLPFAAVSAVSLADNGMLHTPSECLFVQIAPPYRHNGTCRALALPHPGCQVFAAPPVRS